MYERIDETIDSIIDRATRALNHHRAHHETDDGYIHRLVGEFVEAADKYPPGAGHITMAMSVYRMVRQQQTINQLHETLAMRDAALRMMFSLSDDQPT